MPIELKFKPKHISEHKFKEIDFQIMGISFEIQNQMGRYWNEKIYQEELAYRCQKAGFDKVETGTPIIVSFKDFKKEYFLDLLVNDSIIYELKVVENLTARHKNQTLNYLFLCGLSHGKLITLRPASVKSEFISTKITTEKRFNFTIEDIAWENLNDDCAFLKQLFVDLLFEWGTFLDINLYYEAVNYFRGGEEKVVQKINVINGTRTIGKQKVHLLNNFIAFKISSILKHQHKYEQQLHKFLCFTHLKAIQWINIKRDHISFKTISR